MNSFSRPLPPLWANRSPSSAAAPEALNRSSIDGDRGRNSPSPAKVDVDVVVVIVEHVEKVDETAEEEEE
jgi:hypothetical protein